MHGHSMAMCVTKGIELEGVHRTLTPRSTAVIHNQRIRGESLGDFIT